MTEMYETDLGLTSILVIDLSLLLPESKGKL